jgi:hypothetical protein
MSGAKHDQQRIQRSTPLEKAINAVGGSQKVLAEKVGVTPQAINMLKKRGGSLPVTKMRAYEEVTGLPREVHIQVSLPPNGGPNHERESNAFTYVSRE